MTAAALIGETAGQLRQLLPRLCPVDTANITAMGDMAGAYLLVIHLAEPVIFSRNATGVARLQGQLIYAGSARGPGGIAARLTRHLRRDKVIHWHVDELTTRASTIVALALEGGDECEIVSQLIDSGRYRPAMRGFGSSDCSQCPAHLLQPIPATPPIPPGGRHQG